MSYTLIMTMTQDLRKQKVINRWAQFRIAVEVLLHGILLVGLLWLFLFADPFATVMSKYSLEDHQAYTREFFAMNLSKWPIFLGLILLIGVVSILFSHRLVGPAYKLKMILSELNERNLSVRVVFRKSDFFHDLQDSSNSVIRRWKDDIDSISSAHRKMQSAFRNLSEQRPNKETLAELEQQLNSIQAVLKNYRGIQEE